MRFAGAVAVCLAAASCAKPASAPAASAAVYSEVFAYSSVQPALANLAANHLELIQAISSTDIGSADLTALLRAAGAQHVSVRAWLLLPKEQGYWLNDANVDQFGPALDQLLAWIHAEQLPVATITFDIEPGWDYTQQFLAVAGETSSTRLDDLVSLIKSHIDPTGYLAAKAKIQTMIDHVHAAGLRAHCVTYPMVLDDGVNGGETLQDGFDIPVAGLDWDETSFMVYRSTFELLAGTSLTSDLFYSYGQDATAQFGASAGIDFGVIGDDPVSGSHGYQAPAALSVDVAAARAAGISATRLHLYSYEEAAQFPPIAPWLAFADTAASPPPPADQNVQVLRAEFKLLTQLVTAP